MRARCVTFQAPSLCETATEASAVFHTALEDKPGYLKALHRRALANEAIHSWSSLQGSLDGESPLVRSLCCTPLSPEIQCRLQGPRHTCGCATDTAPGSASGMRETATRDPGTAREGEGRGARQAQRPRQHVPWCACSLTHCRRGPLTRRRTQASLGSRRITFSSISNQEEEAATR